MRDISKGRRIVRRQPTGSICDEGTSTWKGWHDEILRHFWRLPRLMAKVGHCITAASQRQARPCCVSTCCRLGSVFASSTERVIHRLERRQRSTSRDGDAGCCTDVGSIPTAAQPPLPLLHQRRWQQGVFCCERTEPVRWPCAREDRLCQPH